MESTIVNATESEWIYGITVCECKNCLNEFSARSRELDFIKYCPLCGASIIRINRIEVCEE